MKIEFNNAVSAYKSTNKFSPIPKVQKISTLQTNRTEDKIEISNESSKKAEINRLAGNTASNIEASHTQKINEIKKAVAEGKYFIGTGELADALLSALL